MIDETTELGQRDLFQQLDPTFTAVLSRCASTAPLETTLQRSRKAHAYRR